MILVYSESSTVKISEKISAKFLYSNKITLDSLLVFNETI